VLNWQYVSPFAPSSEITGQFVGFLSSSAVPLFVSCRRIDLAGCQISYNFHTNKTTNTIPIDDRLMMALDGSDS